MLTTQYYSGLFHTDGCQQIKLILQYSITSMPSAKLVGTAEGDISYPVSVTL